MLDWSKVVENVHVGYKLEIDACNNKHTNSHINSTILKHISAPLTCKTNYDCQHACEIRTRYKCITLTVIYSIEANICSLHVHVKQFTSI